MNRYENIHVFCVQTDSVSQSMVTLLIFDSRECGEFLPVIYIYLFTVTLYTQNESYSMNVISIFCMKVKFQ